MPRCGPDLILELSPYLRPRRAGGTVLVVTRDANRSVRLRSDVGVGASRSALSSSRVMYLM
jgi:hypothetical protein